MPDFFRDKIFDNPITSLAGFILIGIAIAIAFAEMKDSVQLLLVSSLCAAGFYALGMRDSGGNNGGGNEDHFDEELR